MISQVTKALFPAGPEFKRHIVTFSYGQHEWKYNVVQIGRKPTMGAHTDVLNMRLTGKDGVFQLTDIQHQRGNTYDDIKTSVKVEQDFSVPIRVGIDYHVKAVGSVAVIYTLPVKH